MLYTLSRWVVIGFALFIILVGVLMLLHPVRARNYIAKAASTPLIHYSEILIRMIPATALILVADESRYPYIFLFLGGFMNLTSVVLLLIPRQLHHKYALWCASQLNPFLIRMLSPLSLCFGIGLLYVLG